jgi:hypothetical protein
VARFVGWLPAMNRFMPRFSWIVIAALLSADCGGDPSAVPTGTEASPLLVGGGGTGTGGSAPPPVYLPPYLSFVDWWSIDPWTGLIDNTDLVNGSWQSTYPYTDAPPSYIHLVYAPAGAMTDDAVKAINTSNIYLIVNNHEIYPPLSGYSGFQVSYYTNASYGNCPSGRTCLGVDVAAREITHLPPPWTVWIEYWNKSANAWQILTTVVYANPSAQPYFSANVAPTFQSGPCVTCHSMNTAQKVVDHHQQHGVPMGIGNVVAKAGHFGTVLGCLSNCHDVSNVIPGVLFTDTEWMTPAATQGTDWQFMSAQDICAKVKANLPTATDQTNHLFHDARIAWAVDSGVLPFGIVVPKAYPYSYNDFQHEITIWTNSASPCP